ncbi:hypothetical protein R5R35_009048 [Gryllus longicercus]|uniref:Little elongation complex subunit 2 C-terminal domain-containing protein n=1 Tax=Gryllus longicercus TaxID=2509291 RepID=A0AAN9VU97_9ORTH
MDTFNDISWNVPVDPDPEFASAEDFKSKSVTYKILHGTFKAELSSDSSDEPVYEKPPPKQATKKKNKNKKRDAKASTTSKNKGEIINIAEECTFSEDGVRYSMLNAAQHASYVAILYAVQQQQQTTLPPQCMEMKEIVDQEQIQFQEHIKELWKTSYEKHHILVNEALKFTEGEWKSQLKRVKSYPQCYASLKKIPLVYPEDKPEVQMIPLQMLLEMGIVPKLHIPNDPNITTKVSTDYSKMLLLNAPSPEDVNTLHNVTVSADKNAEILAVKEKADIVISSSGLKCIADNISSKFDRDWNIPIVVKQFNIKDGNSQKYHKVVFIDKKLPSKTMSACERNIWFHKLAIKCLMCNYRDPMSFRYPESQLNDLKVEFTNMEIPPNNNDAFSKKTTQDDFDGNSSDSSDLVIDLQSEDVSSGEFVSENKQPSEIQKGKDTYFLQNNSDYTVIPPSSKTNVTYRLWKLNCEERQKEDLNEKFLKGRSSQKELKVLVRCKMDACEYENNQVSPVHISCKLEYQAEFGAEKINASTLAREWTGLFFRPEAVLRRIRIDALTEEIIMAERIMLRDISLMALHLHNLKIRRTVLGSLYQVMKELVTLQPGQFLLSHNLQNGPFITIFEHTNRNFDYNLHSDYESVNPSLINKDNIPQWTPIDTNLITLKQLATKQIPATFQPKQRKK